jgi:phosphoserine phosphatase
MDWTAGSLRGVSWIDEDVAGDLTFDPYPNFTAGDCAHLAEGLRDLGTAISEATRREIELDVVVQPADHREKKLLVADMDSTIIGQECLDELADYAGFKPEVAAITERAMQGELDFAHALAERVALLEGLEEAVIGRCLTERIFPNPGAATLVRTMRARGAETILVSGGFTAFVAPIASRVGFDRFEANVLAASAGRLSGSVEGRIVDSRVKRDALIEARERLGLPREATLAVGDGANDIAMVEEAGLGVAFHAKPALAAVADARIDHHGLEALLWAQGIPRAEWIEG